MHIAQADTVAVIASSKTVYNTAETPKYFSSFTILERDQREIEFLDSTTHLFKQLGPSVGPSVRP